ncbi:MAG TPA: RHS repeat-associated core domain-containing protein [Thermoleophilaceae bacterium]
MAPDPLTQSAVDSDPELKRLEEEVADSVRRTGESDATLEAMLRYFERQLQIEYGHVDPEELADLVTTGWQLQFGTLAISKQFAERLGFTLANFKTPAFQKLEAMFGNVKADPIELATGSLVLDDEDVLIRGAGMDAVFRRTYRSQAAFDGPLGHNWDHSFNLGLTEVGTTRLRRSTGAMSDETFVRHERYPQAGFAYSVPPDGAIGAIVDAGASFDYVLPDGQRHHFAADPAVPGLHRISAIADRFGNRLDFRYADGRLARVEVNHPQRWLAFGYDPQGRIATMEDHSGRLWRYGYDDHGDLIAVRSPPTTEHPYGTTVEYEYSSGTHSGPLAHNLVTALDAEGRALIENEYGTVPGRLDFNRVTRQVAGAGEHLFEYEEVIEEFTHDYTAPERPAYQVNYLGPEGRRVHYLLNRAGNTLLEEEPVVSASGLRWVGRRHRYDGDGRRIASLSAEGRLTQYLYGREQYANRRAVDEAEVSADPELTMADRLGFGDLLATVRRAESYDPAARAAVVGDWGPIFPDVRTASADDVVTKLSYESDFHQPATISDPRFTTSADPDAAEPSGYAATLTRFHYSGAAGLLARIRHPDVTLPSGGAATGVEERFGPYDARGRLLAQVDAAGLRTEYRLHGAADGPREGFVRETVADPGGLAVTTGFELNDRGAVTAIRQPNAVGTGGRFVTTSVLDELDRVVALLPSPPFQHASRFAHDRTGEIVRAEHEIRDAAGTLTPDSPLTQVLRKDRSGLTSCSEVGGLRTCYRYNGDGEPISLIRPSGVRTAVRYDPRGRVATIRRAFGRPEGSRERRSYDDDGLLAAVVSGAGRRVEYRHDPLGRLRQVELPTGDVVRLDYDKADNVVVERLFESAADGSFALAARGEYDYDEWGRLVRDHRNLFPDPLPASDLAADFLAAPGPGRRLTRSYTYDAADRLTEREDELGQVGVTSYDPLGRPLEQVDPLGNRLLYRFDPQGNLLRRDEVDTGPAGDRVFSSSFEYDELHRLRTVTDGMGNVTRHEYDSRDLLTATTVAVGNTRRRAYDLQGRCIEERDERTDAGTPLPPRTRRYEYDSEGNVLAVVDALGTRTEQAFDALDQLVRRRATDGGETRYAYDPDGNATLLAEANGALRRIQRDAAGRTSRIDVDASALEPGESLGGETFEEYGYDAHGLVRRERNDVAQLETRRDSLGRPTSDELTYLDPLLATPSSFVVGRDFDDAGRLSAVRYPGGGAVEYLRDPLGRVARARLTAVGPAHPGDAAAPLPRDLLTVAYRGQRRDAATYADGSTASFGYDAAGRLIEIEHRAPGGATLLHQQRLLDGVGNLRLLVDRSPAGRRVERFGYDALDQLTSVQLDPQGGGLDLSPFDAPPTALDPIPSLQAAMDALAGPPPGAPPTFEYDLAGNRLLERPDGGPPVQTAVDPMSRIVTVDSVPFQHDRLNRVRDDGRWAYEYDARGLLTTVRDATTGDLALQLFHDARGRCVADIARGRLRRVVLDDVTWLEERHDDVLVAQYAHQGRADSTVHVATGGAEHSLHKDAVGSVRVLSAAGAATGSSRYEPFGAPFEESGLAAALRFAGRPWHEEVGLLDMRARVYSPRLGRFLQTDPAGPVTAPNPYLYALANPFRYADPFGDEPGPVTRFFKRAGGGAWGALKNFGGFLRLGLYDSWAQSFSDSARGRIVGAQEWFGSGIEAVSEGRFTDWVGDGVQKRMDAIEAAENRGDYFGSGEVFGDTAMTTYGVVRGGVSAVRGAAQMARGLGQNGWTAFRGVGYGMRRWATTYDGIGIAPRFSVRLGIVRGSKYANYPTYTASESVSRFTYEAEGEIGRGLHDAMGHVRRWRAAPPRQAAMWYGRAVESVVDAKMLNSGDPILVQDVIFRRAFGRNAKGNNIFPDYRLDIGNQSVIDITTPGQALKGLKYPAGNVIEPYTGTLRVPLDPLQPLPMFLQERDDPADQ